MKFCWSTITVNNLDQSIQFYREIVGLPLNARFSAGPASEIAFLGDGETKIELIHNSAVKSANIGPDISLGFEVNSIEEKIAFLKEKGIAIHSGPVQPNPHVRFFHILDPNGLKIQFVENI
jgi:lactoylglutathione lyase